MSFVTFLPAGSPLRANAECPNCYSYERHRLIWLYLEGQTSLFKSKDIKVLHVAPEAIFYSKFKGMYGSGYTPIDMFTPGYRYPKDTLDMDVTDLKLPDNSFDLVLCNHVLEHVPNDSKAVKEIFRVMKPGAMAILQVPIDYHLEKTFEDASITDPDERIKHYGQFDHVRMYGRDYAERLRAVGFKVEVNDLVKRLSKADIFKFGLDREELLYIARK